MRAIPRFLAPSILKSSQRGKFAPEPLFPNLHDEDGIAVVKAALDHGIDMLDTAYMYGLGQSEKLIGEATQGYDRSKIILATKAAQDPHNDLKPNNDPNF